MIKSRQKMSFFPLQGGHSEADTWNRFLLSLRGEMRGQAMLPELGAVAPSAPGNPNWFVKMRLVELAFYISLVRSSMLYLIGR